MRTWNIGKVKITQLVEQIIPEGIPGLMPEATPEALLEIPWLYPEFISKNGEPSLSIHSFILDTPTNRIMVDTCIGNYKSLRIVPKWDQMQNNFLEKMIAAGFLPETIDAVVCTHLHLDHVGWNTIRVDGQWVPTFPNARYLFGRVEYDFMQTTNHDPETEEAWRECNISVGRESISPIFDAGLVDLVEVDHRITDEVSLIPTPGHTPGHVSIMVNSEGLSAIITGDSVHHPCQLAHPDWGTIVDNDPEQSRQTRWELFNKAMANGCLILGTHWTGAAGGTVVRDEQAFRLKFEPTIVLDEKLGTSNNLLM